MGQLAGICCLDDGVVTPKDIAQTNSFGGILDESAVEVLPRSGIALAQRGDATAASETTLSQTRIRAASSICHVDGRLDNTNALLDGLGIRPADVRNDADLVLKLYRMRGARGLVDIIGDWSLALWDPTDRVLFLASDYAGTRPLYFSQCANRVSWSTSLARLIRQVGRAELNRDYVIESLTRGLTKDLTPYQGIHSVPAGGVLRISSKGIRVEAMWQPPLQNVTQLPNDAAYESNFRKLFEEAVAVRLRTPGSVCAELSGGLDSSSVVCIAKRVLASGSAPATDVVTLSYNAEGSSDERFRSTVVRACKFPNRQIDLARHGLTQPESSGGASPAWWVPRHSEVARQMDQLNAAVLLTGQMGDLVMGNWFEGTEQVSHFLRQGAIRRALREAVQWSRVQDRPIYPILWGALSSMAVGPDRRESIGSETSLTVSVWSRAREIQLDRFRTARWRGARPGRRHRLQALVETLEGRVLQCPETLQHRSLSHPFSHRPLVEYMMTIPPEVVYRPHEPRRLMRRALQGLVPQEILGRRSKASYNSTFRESLVPIAHCLRKDSAPLMLADHGFAVAESFRARLLRLEQGLECNETQLRNLILLELWLRSFTASTLLERNVI